MSIKRVEFKNSEGVTLRGILHLSNKPDSPFALIVHCFTCSKDLKAIYRISKVLASAGISVLRFDFTGLGESEGDFSETSFSTNVSDILSACSFLKENYSPPQLLIGHSLGGTAVLQVASAISSCRAVVTMASPSTPAHLAKLLQNSSEEIRLKGEKVRF